jgi:hypothetical protein
VSAVATAAPDPHIEIRGALAEAVDLLVEARVEVEARLAYGVGDDTLLARIDAWLAERWR